MNSFLKAELPLHSTPSSGQFWSEAAEAQTSLPGRCQQLPKVRLPADGACTAHLQEVFLTLGAASRASPWTASPRTTCTLHPSLPPTTSQGGLVAPRGPLWENQSTCLGFLNRMFCVRLVMSDQVRVWGKELLGPWNCIPHLWVLRQLAGNLHSTRLVI